jgi:hypothetical protein
MANRMLRLTVHDPNVIKALDALRKTRKQSAFIVEALRHFLSTPQGQEQLVSYLASQKQRAPTPVAKEAVPTESPPAPTEKVKTNLDDIFKFE